MTEEERLHRRASGVETWERAERNGRAGERLGVPVGVEDGVDTSESSW
jgi:hypothetical protein